MRLDVPVIQDLRPQDLSYLVRRVHIIEYHVQPPRVAEEPNVLDLGRVEHLLDPLLKAASQRLGLLLSDSLENLPYDISRQSLDVDSRKLARINSTFWGYSAPLIENTRQPKLNFRAMLGEGTSELKLALV
jgi:hypothetical protein